MDIDLLAKMVKEAILDNDAVTLPGVGCFVAELMPSTFSDKGYTIHPPYRRLYFTPKQGSDTLLSSLYAEANGVDLSTASRILTEFLAEMKEVLKVRKTVVFPGLGRLRATRENHFFFVADEDLDIYPEGFGLAPVSLKTHVETPAEVASAVAGLAELMTGPVSDIEEIPVSASVPDSVPQTAPDPVPQSTPDPVLQSTAEPEPATAQESTPEPVSEPEPQPAAEPVAEPVQEPELESMIETESVAASPEAVHEPAPASSPVPEPAPEPKVEPEEKPSVGFQPSPAVRKMYRSEYRAEVKKHRHHHRRRRFWRLVLVLACIALALLVAFVVVGRLFPHALDWLLYSGDELEIVRFKY